MTALKTGALPPGCFTDPARPLTFTFEGQTIEALHGQSIAAALYAAGVRVFTRSFKYHRPRGLFCVSGDCPNCLMRVDDRPNVRTCVEPVRPGQVVSSQNAWPSLQFDALHIFDRLDRFLPVGFYYKQFHKPRWMWPLFEHLVRHVAGLGHVDVHDVPDLQTEVEHLQAEVCVIGGGPSGLAAANAAAEAGADVLLLERQPLLGGRLLYEGKRIEDVAGLRATPASNAERRCTLLNTTVFGLYEGNLIGAFQNDRLLKIRAKQIIVSTGGRQIPVPFHNNDLPGVMPLDGVLRLARLHGVKAGNRAFVLATADRLEAAREQLSDIGIEVVGTYVDRWSVKEQESFARSLQARGRKRLDSVVVNLLYHQTVSGTSDARESDCDCDLLCLANQDVPANELLLQAGVRYQYQNGRWQPANRVAGVAAAGGAAGRTDLVAQVSDGRQRGRDAAAALGYSLPPLKEADASCDTPGSGGLDALRCFKDIDRDAQFGKRFVCLCEDVTVKDINQAVAEGFDGIETLKRYSTVNMGPCQGKMCGPTAMALCARATGRDLTTVGNTTSRPPVAPVELAVLAAERRHHPVRRTPLHHWHEAAGARWLDAGHWKRPESYGDPLDEVRVVRTGVGLIDVSTLGKIEVIGPDAAELLERVCIIKWADLKVGRVRYAAMCTEEGILFDDGVGARLGPQHYYLTASTGNAEAVFQWLQLWRTTWRLNVTVLNRTSALAAVNLAGPQSREVLRKLTSLDLSAAAFPYPALREGEVAGVPCRLLRIGFVGELGYEIHCPSAFGWHLWEALRQAGAEFGVRPFGVEAQRIMRLEKGHLIVGQDTDALSDPLSAGLEALVRFEKPLFHGRDALVRLQSMQPRSRLVGFYMEAPPAWGDLRALEGCQVVEGRWPAGRVTSARHSPTLDRVIGLAWVPVAQAEVGERFRVRWRGADVPAVVVPLPFYDPQGTRLKV
jgi:sarcosine oxidase subunit alpha